MLTNCKNQLILNFILGVPPVTQGGRQNWTLTKYSLKSFDYMAKSNYQSVLAKGFDAINSRGTIRAQAISPNVYYYFKRLLMKLGIRVLIKCNYRKIIENYYVDGDKEEFVYPTIIPNFDRTPRAGWNTNNLWHNSTPKLFEKQLIKALNLIKDKKDEHKILFLQPWNEWGKEIMLNRILHLVVNILRC